NLPRPNPTPCGSRPTQIVPSAPTARSPTPCPVLDFSAWIGYVCETPSCQWTTDLWPPSQNPPCLSTARAMPPDGIVTPSRAPKHLSSWSVTRQRGLAPSARITQSEPSGPWVALLGPQRPGNAN